MSTCTICQRDTNADRLRRGRCRSCYRYLRAHGTDRPHDQMRRSPHDSRPLCAHCRQQRAGVKSARLCSACYQYQQQRGKPRPRYLWAEKCKICSRPRSEDRRDGFVKGRCRTCYNYYFRYGHDRSLDLIAALAPQGWCECGRPAVAITPLRWGLGRLADYPLCADCMKAEYA